MERTSTFMLILLLAGVVVTFVPGCDDTDGEDDDDDSADVELQPLTAGEDIDTEETRELASSYELPPQFYDALDTLGVTLPDLGFPDAGSTYMNTPTRLHWTNTLRHEGETPPTFAQMAAEDVEAALATEAQDTRVRELLVAQLGYNTRDEFVTSRYDRAYSTEDDLEQPLLAALQAYYEHDPVEGNEPPDESWADVEGDVMDDLEAFPYPARAAIALAIPALVRAAELRDEALFDGCDLTMEQWAELHDDFYRGYTGFSTYSHEYGTDAHPCVDWEELAHAGQLVVRALESLRLHLADVPPVPGAYLHLNGPLGEIAISLEEADDTWEGDDHFLLLDLAGNDTYLDQVAVNISIYHPVSAVLDMQGNDNYRPTSDWTIDDGDIPTDPGRMSGAGLFGVAVLSDAAGDDTYHAAALAQGVGVFGVGVLMDHGGADVYRGYYSCQGHAEWGYGLLVDLGDDDDYYETLQTSQGYGGPRGIGWLVDEGGNDAYLAIADPIIWDWAGEGTNWSGSQGFGYGVRDGFFTAGDPIFSGGLGGLFDLDGDDDYQCAVMCQGFGYAFGAGLFYDARGNDDHLVTHKYALGSATHWAIGLYLDGDGEDTYRNSGDDECIGLGYDASVAYHIDRGDEADIYTIDNVGNFTLGAGRIPALGVLINEGGDDEYHIPGSGTRALGRSYTADGNRSDYLAATINMGMFFDLGGSGDLYDIAREGVGNGLEWIQTDPDGGDWTAEYDFGYGLDVD